MSRWRASAYHLLISLGLALVVVTLLIGAWYPPPLFQSGGGMDLFFLIIGVDIVLGPLLTLAVFRSGKRGLRFDLTVIGLLQVAALAYGMSIITQTRPAFIVAMPNRVVVVHADELHPDPPPPAEFASAPWLGPRMVTLRLPEDAELRQEITLDVMQGNPDFDRRPAFFAPLDQGYESLFQSPLPLEPLLKFNPDLEQEILDWLKQQGVENIQDAAFLPVMTRSREIALFVDTRRKLLLGMRDVPSNY